MSKIGSRAMKFSEEIIYWYKNHKIDLPLRNTNDHYIIWLSEIIMQQTRVGRECPILIVLPKKPNGRTFCFGHRGNIKTLAGLGYYSRGRNSIKLHRQ
jgi:A/G-specific adenine glycosylase